MTKLSAKNPGSAINSIGGTTGPGKLKWNHDTKVKSKKIQVNHSWSFKILYVTVFLKSRNLAI